MSATLRWGLLIGLVITILDLALNLAMRPMLAPLAANPTPEAAAASAGPLLALSCLSLVVSALLYFVAGHRAGGETGLARYGVMAGLLAGLVSGVVALLVEAVYPMPQPQVAGAASISLMPQWLTALIGLGVGLVIALVFSAAGAWWATRNREPAIV